MREVPYLNTSLTHFVPILAKDPYQGDSKLSLTSIVQSLDPNIPSWPRRAKEDYKNIRYPTEYTLDEQSIEVELPTKERDNKPVQDPIPRVKKKNHELQ